MSTASTTAPSSSDGSRVRQKHQFNNIDGSRHLHISKAPSNSLFERGLSQSSKLLSDAYEPTINMIIFHPTTSFAEERYLETLVAEQISRLPKHISWFLAKATDDTRAWLLVEAVTQDIDDSDISQSPTEPKPKSVDEDIASPTLRQPCHTACPNGLSWSNESSQTAEISDNNKNSISLSVSGIQMTPGDSIARASSSRIDNVTDRVEPILKAARPSCPPEILHAKMIIPALGLPAPTASKEAAAVTAVKLDTPAAHASTIRSSLALLRETAKTKLGQKQLFIETCLWFQKSLLQNGSSGLITVDVLQDVGEPNHGRIFYITYYFAADTTLEHYRQTDDWRRWRRSVAHILEGPPIFKTYVAIFDTRPAIPNVGAYYDNDEVSDDTGSKASFDIQSSRPEIRSNPAEQTTAPEVVQQDKRLQLFQDALLDRMGCYHKKLEAILSLPIDGVFPKDLYDVAAGYRHFGLRFTLGKHAWLIREWIPNAKAVYLSGDFNQWDTTSAEFRREPEELFGSDVWVCSSDDIPLAERVAFQHLSRYKLYIKTLDGRLLPRIPPCAQVVHKETDSEIRNALVWNPPSPLTCQNPRKPLAQGPKFYEMYIGLCPNNANENRFGRYKDCIQLILPRIVKLGYNAIILIGVVEHNLTSMGWDVTNYFAPASEFGTPDELSEFVDAAHGYGLSVLVSVVHSHAAVSSDIGLHELDGTDEGFFLSGARGRHAAWNGRIFDFEKPQVCRFLLGQLCCMVDKYGFDGFRFEGITSLLFHHHGIGREFNLHQDLGNYFSFDTNNSASSYLMLANELVHTAFPGIKTIASDFSRAPTVGVPVIQGGLGFDFCLAPSLAHDEWTKQLRWPDDKWNIESLVAMLEERRSVAESCIATPESYGTSVYGRRRLRVAMFAWESLHTHAVGGVAPHVTELAAGLCRLGHEVHIFVRATGQTAAHSVHYGVHYHECPFQLNRDFILEIQAMCNSFIWHMRETEEFLGCKFDICHAHDWLASRALVPVIQSGHHGILTIHSTEYGRCGNQRYCSGDSKRISDIEREACHFCERIICVSGVLAEEVVSLFGVHSDKIQVIYNGINAEKFDGFEDAAPVKAAYDISPMEPMFLFVGRLTVQKGPDLLVDAIPHILKFRGDAKFVFVGDGYMRSDLISRSKALGVWGSCRFTGAMCGQALISLFKAADAIVVPSRNEPFGIVVLEAWSSFKPVVATTCGGPRDFVTANVDGILVDPNVSSIAWGCCEILKNFDHARWMGERGRVKAAYNFSWNHVSKLTERVYYEQLNKHDTPVLEGGTSGDWSLASRLMGSSMMLHMGVFDGADDTVIRGMALHKLVRLLSLGLGGQGYMNFMGNEFGHPEHVDVPRSGNNFSFDRFHRKYALASDQLLKYKHLEFFDACIIRLETIMKWLQSNHQYVVIKNQEDKMIAFERGCCLFVINLHPAKSYEGYCVGHSLGAELTLLLDTDDERFGGFGRLAQGYGVPFPNLERTHGRTGSVKLYIPSRTGLILTTVDKAAELKTDPVHCCPDVDTYLKLECVPAC